ncbi:MAG: 50S ribosomal protein L10 [Ignavibacteriae bacterium]|nr:50S ribosomal protein L10 [Ignavibacteriota bacterium]MCB9216267.1 50S ribosomal protein L10 [Ignavibacteria bacterium]
MTKEQKIAVVNELSEMFEGAAGFYSIDFTGLNVADTIELRREFKNAGVRYRVAKNTLIRRALSERGEEYSDEVLERLVGQTGVAIGYEDPAVPARILKKFIEDRKAEKPKLNFAVIEGTIYNGDQLKQVAAMPSRQDIMASILGSLQAPVSGIVGSINAVMRDLSSLIEEVAKKQAEASA